MTGPDGWIETTGTVTQCRFRSPGLSTLAFGFQTTRRFRISFDYYAHGRLYSDSFGSDTAILRTKPFRSSTTRFIPARTIAAAARHHRPAQRARRCSPSASQAPSSSR